jgi:hypothetical protein
MYLSHYNLLRKPFQLTTDPRFLWLSEKNKIENGQASIDPEAELFKSPRVDQNMAIRVMKDPK